jgi:transmembrane sensor
MGMAIGRAGLSFAMIDDRDWERLARFITGEAAPDEAASTHVWLEADNARREVYERMRHTWELAKVDPSQWNSRAAWRHVAPHLSNAAIPTSAEGERATPRGHARVKLTRVSGNNRWHPSRWSVAAGIAAGLVILAGGVLSPRILGDRRAAAARIGAAAKAETMNEVVTRRAQRATIQLADGTRITLNVDSKLRYPQGYGVSSRDLHLEGEAFFDVAHGTIPFVVHTAQGVARDVGTRFVVTAYPSTNDTRVVVSDGMVVLTSHDSARNSTAMAESVAATAAAERDSVVLTSATLGVASPNGEVRMSEGIDVADHLAWIEGRLVFVGAPLGEVVQRLSRWYDIDVRLADASLESVRFSGTFQTENPGYVLNLLAASAGAKLARSGAAYVLSARK